VPVVDALLVLAAQTFVPLHQLLGVPDLQRLRTQPHVHHLADQSRRHRVHVLLHPDRAAPADTDPQPLQALQAPRRQRPQTAPLRRELLRTAGIAPAHDLPEEVPVRRDAVKVPTATQQQLLLDLVLEAAMPLLAVPILVPAGGIGRLAFQTVMRQQRPILGGELLGVAILVDRQGHAVGAMPLGHAAQSVQRVLESFTQTGEALGEAQRHVFPVRVGQDKVIDQVRERFPLDGHVETVHVREVRSTQPAGVVDLGEEDFLGRTVLGLPLTNAALQRAAYRLRILAGILTLQPLPQSLGLQLGLAREQFLQAGPDLGERIGPGAPGVGLARLAGQLAGLAVFARGFAIHARLHRCFPQRCSLQQPAA
jgi:hypothetical protein